MNGDKWPIVFEDADTAGDRIAIFPCKRGVFIEVSEAGDGCGVVITPAQSATLRAALEAAEKEMT